MLDKYIQQEQIEKLKIFLPAQSKSKELSPSFNLNIITQFYPPDYAATGQLIEELAVNLGRLGIQVRVFTGQPGYAFKKHAAPILERSEKILIRRSRTSRMWNARIRGKAINGCLFFLRTILYLLNQKNHGDLLLLTTAPAFLPIVGYIAKLLFGLPYVCLMYDLYPDVAVELDVLSKKNWLVKLWRSLNQKVWQNSEKIVVLSSTMREKILSYSPELSEKIVVIHNWANPNWIVPIEKENNWFAQKHELVNTFTVQYSGNMGRCHELDTILEAARQLQDESIQFVFIGGGAKFQSSLERVKKLGLNNCRFLPYQDKQDLPYSLTACDLSLVSISPKMEGIVAPSKLYGILAAGRPVAAICEPHSYLRHLLRESGCGAAFNSGDASGLAQFIRRLKSDRELVKQMGMAGRQYLQFNFTPEIIAKQYSNVLQQAFLTAKRRIVRSKTNNIEAVTEES
ncbi:glycosyltransferase WbuB [Chroococcidiopsis sp. CCALA 051]|uniref:glycosyltransferase family 4 protein n=1 Tax=Chroococcidiopsis sp. CCALA 051 TaxID=869949 RepID=UPI000D0DA5AB|nr:glycosyltransferase family 4 protein [Chroococcidiopsis sp. CCALA 051]MBE9014673.1 glycosyltransferase family 4 protein [Chroococcidiopsidales cyanobacterium LEGE 13417]PSM50676.1 glycosyltransferase WbuB [Chroococcidiopsis sp. CCALA 051]